jgi:hypothetical protein
MDFIKKFVSRRLFVVFYGGGIGAGFKVLQVNDQVTLAVLGLCATYLVGRAISDKKAV